MANRGNGGRFAAGNGVTPQAGGRNVPAAPDSTKTPQAPHNPGHPSLNVTQHSRPAAVQGPASWDTPGPGATAPSTRRGAPPHANPSASYRPHSDAQVTKTAGTNPNPPAARSQSAAPDPAPAGGPGGYGDAGDCY